MSIHRQSACGATGTSELSFRLLDRERPPLTPPQTRYETWPMRGPLPSRAAGNVKRVLVVDDEEPIRLTVAEALQDEGYDVVTAQNGAEALERVRATRPDGVVLDLMMPVLDGWGFLEACRQDELCAKTPVLVVSAYRKLAVTASELRLHRFLAKPFELEELIEAVADLVA
jgi:two-component system chemotaxis response regulator CheY